MNDWISRAEEVAMEVLAQHAETVDQQGQWPDRSLAALAESGLMGLTIPSELDGAGEGPSTFLEVMQCLSRQCASTGMIYLMHTCATQVILSATMFSRREEIVRDIAQGKHLTTLAFSERGSRSHFWAPVSQAARDSNAFILSAEKSWVTSAGHAQSYISSTRTAGEQDPQASTIYFVPADSRGLQIGDPFDGLGLRGNASSPIRFENVSVSDDSRVSADGGGFQCMLSIVLPWFQIGSAAVSLGIAQAATSSTISHLLRSRFEHLGQSLADLMNLRARLAQMQIETDTLQAFLRSVALSMEAPDDSTLLRVLQSKAAANEMALQVTDLAMKTCGGAAFSRHLSVERNFRDARAGSVMAPTTDVLYDFIGKSLLDIPLF